MTTSTRSVVRPLSDEEIFEEVEAHYGIVGVYAVRLYLELSERSFSAKKVGP